MQSRRRLIRFKPYKDEESYIAWQMRNDMLIVPEWSYGDYAILIKSIEGTKSKIINFHGGNTINSGRMVSCFIKNNIAYLGEYSHQQ